MKDQKKIRLGLIGVGNWALFAHVRVLRLLPEYEIVAIYSQRKEAAKAAAKEYGIPHVAESLDALVTDPLVDQVLLLTTSQQHEEGSRGYLRLKSANPADASEIHANMLGDPRDLAALRKGLEIGRELGNSAAMKPFVKRKILPGDVKGEALDNLIRDGAQSMHHVTGTLKMGQDAESVVDSKLRGYGVKKLPIADGSIMPTVTTGNTQAPCVIIGERIAELLAA